MNTIEAPRVAMDGERLACVLEYGMRVIIGKPHGNHQPCNFHLHSFSFNQDLGFQFL